MNFNYKKIHGGTLEISITAEDTIKTYVNSAAGPIEIEAISVPISVGDDILWLQSSANIFIEFKSEHIAEVPRHYTIFGLRLSPLKASTWQKHDLKITGVFDHMASKIIEHDIDECYCILFDEPREIVYGDDEYEEPGQFYNAIFHIDGMFGADHSLIQSYKGRDCVPSP
jgi:hypothetical protein